MENIFFRANVQQTDLDDTAKELLSFFRDQRIFLFEGELGAGKTTIIKHLMSHLGVRDQGGSPSFGIIHDHEGSVGPVYHMDLYRIKKNDELDELGINEYLDSGNYCFIEWPEKVMERLPLGESVLVKIDYLAENLRCISAAAL